MTQLKILVLHAQSGLDYRWFPGGKIVFLAPTKPLVAQQIEASHQTCGIPGDDAAELTGHVKDDRRAILVSSILPNNLGKYLRARISPDQVGR